MPLGAIDDFRRKILSLWTDGSKDRANVDLSPEEFRNLINPTLVTINKQLFGGKGIYYQKDDIYGIKVRIEDTDYYIEVRNLHGCRHFELYLIWIETGRPFQYVIGYRRRAKNIDHSDFKNFDVGICSLRRKTLSESQVTSYITELLRFSPKELADYLTGN